MNEPYILGSAVKGLDFQVLPDPFEKKAQYASGGDRARLPGERSGPGGWSKRLIPYRFPGPGNGPGAALQDSQPAPGGTSAG